MLLVSFVLSLLAAPPSPAPKPVPVPARPLFEVWSWFEPDPADSVGVSPPLPEPPELLAPRGPWAPMMVVRADGSFAFLAPYDGSPDFVPYVEGRLDPARLALLEGLVATLGQSSRRWTCTPQEVTDELPIGVWDTGHRLRLVAAGSVVEWPDCAEELVPARVEHLVRVAGALLAAPAVPPISAPIFALSHHSLMQASASVDELVIDGAGRWRTPKASGALSPAALAKLREAIRDTRLEMRQQLIHCEAVPTQATQLDLGLAGSISWVSPCGDPPHPDVSTLVALARALVAEP